MDATFDNDLTFILWKNVINLLDENFGNVETGKGFINRMLTENKDSNMQQAKIKKQRGFKYSRFMKYWNKQNLFKFIKSYWPNMTPKDMVSFKNLEAQLTNHIYDNSNA